MKKFVVDRLEGDFAVCEEQVTGEMQSIKKELLPQLSEGDILILSDSGEYSVDCDESEKRRKAAFDLQESLFD